MNYPIWQFPILGGPWVIGLIACIHIFISHFAVGGGMFFAITEELAFKNQDDKLYKYLKSHSKFFLLLTTVAGAVTGVAIWWAISLFSPDGIHSLIQTYTLGWACEYIFFVAEIATIFVYYYTWDRISAKEHLLLARYYAIFSILTLVIINGILTYMLTPGSWLESKNWLEGFFNQTYWPSLIIRLLMMAAVAGIYALLTAARIKNDDEFRTRLLRYASKWFLPIFFLGPLVAYWFYSNIPNDVANSILNGLQSSGTGNFSIMARAAYLTLILSGTILVFVFVGPYLNPQGFSFRSAVMFLICGLLVTSIGEWSREMLRKPYVIYDYMYSNGIRKDQIAEINSKGFIASSKWANVIATAPNQTGQLMFKGQCISCHTIDGYRSIKKLIGKRDLEAIESFLLTIHETEKSKNPYLHIMPPLVGTSEEIKALAKYIEELNH